MHHFIDLNFQFPHVFQVDIKGNFFRGLIIGVLVGFGMAMLTLLTAVSVLRYMQ